VRPWAVLVAALLGCSAPGPHAEKAKGVYTGPPILAIRWDAFSNDDTLSWWTSLGLSKTVPSGTKYHHRKPSLWDDFQLWHTDDSVDTQAIIDAEIAAAKGKLDGFLYDLYPPASIVPGFDENNIVRVYEAHRASANKDDVKFAFILQYGWIGIGAGKFQEMCDYIADAVSDSAYMRIDGKPLIVLYNDAQPNGWEANPDKWEQLKDTIGEAVYGGAINSSSMRIELGLQFNVTYGPNGALPAGTGRRSFAALRAIDESHDGTSFGSDRCSSRTLVLDRRPFVSEAGTTWVDQGTQPEVVAHLQSGMAPSQKIMVIYSWDEVTEGGPGITPTFQEGDRYLRALDAARNANYPSTESFKWSFNWLSCGSSGTWAEHFPDPNGVPGCHDGDQVHSTDTGAYKTITLSAFESCEIYAETGPDCGILEVLKDDVLDQTIDCYAASQTVSALVATVTFGALATHTLKVRVKGTKNASSSSVKIKLDYAVPVYIP
jgi:hypothetical protein